MSILEVHCCPSLVIGRLLNQTSPPAKTRAARILPCRYRADFLVQWNQKIDLFNKDLGITLLRTGIHLPSIVEFPRLLPFLFLDQFKHPELSDEDNLPAL